MRHTIWSSLRRDHPWGQPSQPPQLQARKIYACCFPTPSHGAGRNSKKHRAATTTHSKPGARVRADNHTLGRGRDELAPSDFISKLRDSVALMQEETKNKIKPEQQSLLNLWSRMTRISTGATERKERIEDNRLPPMIL
ncbi:hypothetical protein Tco_1267769 [Tanacetum coccineum]